MRSEFKKERFVYIFIIISLIDGGIAEKYGNSATWLSVIASLVLLLGLANWLEFPWIMVHLERWLNLVYRAGERWIAGKKSDEVEPI